jgi:hypothetical protein
VVYHDRANGHAARELRRNVTVGHDLPRISALLAGHSAAVPRPAKNAKDFTELMMKTKNTIGDPQREEASLDRCYGKIGIPAVAAALPYQSDAKNPACAPLVSREEKWLAEMAEA